MKIQNYGDWEGDRHGGHHPPACTCVRCTERRLRQEEERRTEEYAKRVARAQPPRPDTRRPPQPPSETRWFHPRRRRGLARRLRWGFLVAGAAVVAVVLYANGLFGSFQGGESAAVATGSAPASSEPEGKYPGGASLDAREIEEWVLIYTNEEREKAGRVRLEHDPAISAIARRHSDRMAATGTMSHEISGAGPTDRALAAGYDCQVDIGAGLHSYGLSENIVRHPRVQRWQGTERWGGETNWRPTEYDRDEQQVARSMVDSWMDSWGHKINMLDRDARRIGVGVAVSLSGGYGWDEETVWGTQNFSGCAE